ncbi:MAG: hypothetical protein HZA47_06495 [Planctomycetes bacterium]|uniref:hypothetical protein n=1 Tax=Candidatus Wunengus sp. YC65 TaxID=3367701 RepID=UPI001D875DEF|nr:hypothetical protein [Planctomycetota bacterium]
MIRFLVFLIAVYIIYYLIKNSIKGRTARNTYQSPQGHKEKKPDVVNTHLKEISYVYYSSAKDGDTCDVCKALDGSHLLPNHKTLHNIKPPHTDCKSSKGCRCTLVYVTRDEEGSKEIESLLKRHGGMCDKQTIERGLVR